MERSDREKFRKTLMKNREFSYLLEKDSKIIAYVIAEAKDKSLFIHSLACLGEYRHMGYGTTLMKKVINEAKEKKIMEISLYSRQKNIEYYQHMGFHEVSDHETGEWKLMLRKV